jgi:hypothetical protein
MKRQQITYKVLRTENTPASSGPQKNFPPRYIFRTAAPSEHLYVLDTLPSPPMLALGTTKGIPAPCPPPNHVAATQSTVFYAPNHASHSLVPTKYPPEEQEVSGMGMQSWPLPKKFGICSNQKRRAPTNVLFVCCAWSFLPLVLCNYLYD